MAESKNLKVTGDAAEVVKGVQSYDHGAPSASEMASTSGVEVGPALTYTSTLASLGTKLEQTFQELLREVNNDCDRSKQSIEQMQELDGEIASLLNGLNPESGAGSSPNGGGTGSEDVQW